MSLLDRFSERVGRGLSLGAQRIGSRANLALDRAIELLARRDDRQRTRIELTQLQPPNISQWTFDNVREALEAHELGYFLNSAALVDAFGRDDRISACLNTRVQALVGKGGADFQLEPAESSNKRLSKQLAARVSGWWRHGLPETTLARVHRGAVALGFDLSRIHWDLIDGERVPRLEPWDSHAVYFNWATRRYNALSQEGVFEVTPGTGEWFLFEPTGSRSWMGGAVRALGVPYVFRNFTQRDWARYCEKHGIPILAIKEPQGQQWNTQRAGFYAKLRRIGQEGIIRLPQDDKGNGFGLDIIEPKDTSWEAFKEFLIRLDINIAVNLLGQNLTTEAGTNGGSHAAVKGANNVRLDYLAADAEALSTALRDQVLKPWMRFNVNAEEDLAPWPDWATRPPEDKEARAKVLYCFAQAVDLLTSTKNVAVSQLAVDFQTMATELDIPLRTKQPDSDAPAPSPLPEEPAANDESEDENESDTAKAA